MLWVSPCLYRACVVTKHTQLKSENVESLVYKASECFLIPTYWAFYHQKIAIEETRTSAYVRMYNGLLSVMFSFQSPIDNIMHKHAHTCMHVHTHPHTYT